MIRKFVWASAAVIALAGCSTTGAPGSCTTPICVAEKLDTGAHDVHAAIANTLTSLANSGVLHGAQAAQAQSLLDQSEAMLKAADTALAAGNAADVATQIANATALVAQIQAIIAGMHK